VRLSPLGTSATIGPLNQLRVMDDDEYGALGGMSGRVNQSTRRKPVLAPLCPPQISLEPHPDSNLGRSREKPAINLLSYCRAACLYLV
jgi:hypothetical protein